MGEVYLAREHATERTVAMKFLHSPADPDLFERFLVEVRALARLDHPNIVAIHSADLARRDPFFTMEYAAGGSLARWVERVGPPPPEDAARLMATVARAVHAAHVSGILHRDLKPSNLLLQSADWRLESDGAQLADVSSQPSIATLASAIPKVSDFGLAKRTDCDDELTATTLAIGTPGYMAPEQVSRRYGHVGPAVDVHGLGATLYHLLTGRPPLPTGSPEEVIRRLTDETPPRPRAIRSDIPAGLEAIVMKCLAKDQADRYPTAEAMADDLDRFLAGLTPSAPRLTLRRRAAEAVGRRWRLVLGTAAAALVAAGLFVIGATAGPRPTVADPPDPAATIQRELTAGRPVTLVGETGLPRYHRAVLGPITLGESSLGDGACTFRTDVRDVLELLPDPGVNRYRVRLDIRHVAVNPDPTGADQDHVGFYFGRRMAAAPGRATIHAMFAVLFRDYPAGRPLPGKDPAEQQAHFEALGLFQNPRTGVVPKTRWLANLPFPTVPVSCPGRWRTITAEVTADELHIQWADDGGEPRELLRWPGERVRTEARTLNDQLAHADPSAPAALPDWRPRMPLGVFANRAVVSIRNVVITPLP
jgi:serine/threonine-protein kinase